MGLRAFLDPVNLQDTPRLFTALAEWLSVFVYFKLYRRRQHDLPAFAAQCAVTALVQAAVQFVAGLLPLPLWILSMMAAVGTMYLSLYWVLDIKPRDCGVLMTHAFVLAEFAASLYVQLYVWATRLLGTRGLIPALLIMAGVYGITFPVYYRFEKGNIPPQQDLDVSRRELLSVIATGVGAFIMSNISFVTSGTPFSATENILYVRTLVDFGGLLMLVTEMGRRNEMAAKSESDAINLLLQKQYEQYRLAMDNSEGLRKEMHDMKHYIMALKKEDDPARRAEVLADMEQSIAVQESFMNTGNKVLDVILTTKSLQCQKKGITLNAMVQGELLADIHVKDICSLFGNLLDNAIEATQQIEEKDRRLIMLSVRARNQFVVVECENCSDSANVALRGQTGRRTFGKEALPPTTKKDNVRHGYGLKSIAQVAEKYGGAMNCTFENGWFRVKVLLNVR